MAAFGSATWEYFGETNSASLNDFINTTLGGIALGEMFHRTAWLVRNTRATGRGRMWREIAATAVDPVGGYNNFVRGDAGTRLRQAGRHGAVGPGSRGVARRAVARSARTARSRAQRARRFSRWTCCTAITRSGRTRTPYDAFAVRLRFGGGSSFSEARVRGRLLGEPLSNEKLHFSVIQTYDYQNNDAYATGAQSFDAALGFTQPLSSRYGFWLLGWGGLTILGAVDSLPPGVDAASRARRRRWLGERQLRDRASTTTVREAISASSRSCRTTNGSSRDSSTRVGIIYSLDGVRANHFLQRARLDLMLPVRGAFGFGGSVEYFNRHTFYQDATHSEREFHYPQVQGIPHMDTTDAEPLRARRRSRARTDGGRRAARPRRRRRCTHGCG